MEIVAIFDLRARAEREQDPTAWASPDIATYVFRAGHKRRLIDMALDYPPSRAGVIALMRNFYRAMPQTMGHVFGEMIRRMAAGSTPCIIHCSAGKDRTGVAVAILLAALGVPREDIVANYVISASIAGLEADMARAVTRAGDVDNLVARYPADAIAAMMDASPDYIRQALDAIDGEFGSVDDYLRDGGVTGDMLKDLRRALLEGQPRDEPASARRRNLSPLR